MGMVTALMQQSNNATNTQKVEYSSCAGLIYSILQEPQREARTGGVMKIQLEALEAECDRLRHDAAQAKSLATEVVFLKRQIAGGKKGLDEFSIDGNMVFKSPLQSWN